MFLATGRLKLPLLAICLLMMMSAVVVAGNLGDLESRSTATHRTALTAPKSTDAHSYDGYLRIYVTEIKSRYPDAGSTPYDFGFIEFAVNEGVLLEYGDTIIDTVVVNGLILGLEDEDENNIQIMGAVFNGQGHEAYSDTGTGTSYPYQAHYVDAATAVLAGETNYDDATAPYTHTVFFEEGTSPS